METHCRGHLDVVRDVVMASWGVSPMLVVFSVLV